jgi:hypothetical protein
MKVVLKFKAFALWLMILSFLFVSSAWGETNIKKAIIGKWEQYDEELGGIESIEFFEDGTVFSYHAGWKLSAGGDYRFVDRNRIRINLGGLWGLVGPIVCGVSVTENELILTMPDGKVEKYNRVSAKETTSAAEEEEEELAEIKEQIEKRLRMLSTTKYPYLLDTDSVRSAISTTWMHLTSPIRGNLVEKYNEFYYAAWDYQDMAISALRKARSSLTENNIPLAKKHIGEADRYIRLANLPDFSLKNVPYTSDIQKL